MFKKLTAFIVVIAIVLSLGTVVFASPVSVNGVVSELDSFTTDGVMFVPFRDFFSLLGAEVSWDYTSRTGRAVIGDFRLSVAVGEKFFVVDGVRYDIDAPTCVVGDRIYVPVRAAAEAFRCSVWYDDSTGIVYVSSGERPWSLGDVFRGIISAKGWNGVHVALQVADPVDVNGIQCASVVAYSEYGPVATFAVSYDLSYVFELYNGYYTPLHITR